MKRHFQYSFLIIMILFISSCMPPINRMDHRKFAYVHESIPDAKYDIRYITDYNFLGCPVDGYLDTVAILSNEAMAALIRAAHTLRTQGLRDDYLRRLPSTKSGGSFCSLGTKLRRHPDQTYFLSRSEKRHSDD